MKAKGGTVGVLLQEILRDFLRLAQRQVSALDGLIVYSATSSQPSSSSDETLPEMGSWSQANARDLPPGTALFDMIIAVSIFQTLGPEKERARLLFQFRQLLRPGGILVTIEQAAAHKGLVKRKDLLEALKSSYFSSWPPRNIVVNHGCAGSVETQKNALPNGRYVVVYSQSEDFWLHSGA